MHNVPKCSPFRELTLFFKVQMNMGLLTLDKGVVQFTSDQSTAQAVSSVYWTVQEILTPNVLALMQRMLLFIVEV